HSAHFSDSRVSWWLCLPRRPLPCSYVLPLPVIWNRHFTRVMTLSPRKAATASRGKRDDRRDGETAATAARSRIRDGLFTRRSRGLARLCGGCLPDSQLASLGRTSRGACRALGRWEDAPRLCVVRGGRCASHIAFGNRRGSRRAGRQAGVD